MDNLLRKNLTTDIGFALSNFALIFSYALCCSAALGQGIGVVCLATSFCLLFSSLLKDKVLCPSPVLLVPLIFVFSKVNTLAGILSLLFGGAIYVVLRKPLSKITVPKNAVTDFKIFLAICATVIFTNIYFGIGAQGNNPVEMIKSYVSLGFHPHFTGLLTGTITLFIMITYPFKFRKLNKYLPAEFVSILVPCVINIILNPDKRLTNVNEATTLAPLSLVEFKNLFTFNGNKDALIINTVIGCLIFAICFFILFSQMSDKEAILCGCTNASSAAIVCIPTGTREARGVTATAAYIGVAVTVALCLLCPSIFSRIPLHSVGAMLIVSSWQEALRKEVSSNE